ncbi:hypothetical protein XNA1_4400001 [Xenorhabdus nematophila str. Anatoliense]|nr:hypothetical protein XNA1_4400001 [Xenorhabdus nematophila str. Anatoliense]
MNCIFHISPLNIFNYPLFGMEIFHEIRGNEILPEKQIHIVNEKSRYNSRSILQIEKLEKGLGVKLIR